MATSEAFTGGSSECATELNDLPPHLLVRDKEPNNAVHACTYLQSISIISTKLI